MRITMPDSRVKGSRRKSGDKQAGMEGTSLFEAVVASLLFLIVIAGLLPLVAMTLDGTSANDLYTQATSAARAKLEEIKNLSYPELGICKDKTNCPDPSPGNGPALNKT